MLHLRAMNTEHTCLVVEDDQFQREYLASVLNELSIKADTAQNKTEAENLLRRSIETQKHYSLIFLDIMLPDGTGIELLNFLRSSQFYIKPKIIMITALDDLKNIAGAFAADCDAYIVKPAQKEDIFNILDNFHIL